MTNETQSKRFELNKEDLIKIGKGAIIAILGAVLTYGSSIISSIDFKGYAAIVTAIWSILVNAGWKWIKSRTPAQLN